MVRRRVLRRVILYVRSLGKFVVVAMCRSLHYLFWLDTSLSHTTQRDIHHIPLHREIIIKPSQYNYNNYWDCDGVNELYRQFQLGEDSFYAPYIRYILNQPRGRTPQDWTVGGRRLLDVITNKEQLQQHDQQHEQQQQQLDNDDGRIMNRLPPTYKTSDFQQGSTNVMEKTPRYPDMQSTNTYHEMKTHY